MNRIAAEATVLCEGKEHRIVLKDNGKLVLMDHPHFREELALLALGDTKPSRCLEVLKAWSYLAGNKVPSELVPYVFQASRLRERRRENKWTDDPLLYPPQKRRERQIERVATQCLQKASYAQGKECTALVVNSLQRPDTFRLSRGGVMATIHASWYKKVYKRGIAVVDGIFVCECVKEKDGAFFVHASRPYFSTPDEDVFISTPDKAVIRDGKVYWDSSWL